MMGNEKVRFYLDEIAGMKLPFCNGNEMCDKIRKTRDKLYSGNVLFEACAKSHAIYVSKWHFSRR